MDAAVAAQPLVAGGLLGALLEAFTALQLRSLCQRFGLSGVGRRALLCDRITRRLASELRTLLPEQVTRPPDCIVPSMSVIDDTTAPRASVRQTASSVSSVARQSSTPALRYVGHLFDDNRSKPDQSLALVLAADTTLATVAVTHIRRRIHAPRSANNFASRLQLALRSLASRGVPSFLTRGG